MPHEPILTTVIGSYPFPGWLELVGLHTEETRRRGSRRGRARRGHGRDRRPGGGGPGRRSPTASRAATTSTSPSMRSSRASSSSVSRAAGSDRRRTTSAAGIGSSASWPRPAGSGSSRSSSGCASSRRRAPRLKVSVPGPYTLAGRIEPNADYPDRAAVTEALIPIVQAELSRLVEAGWRRSRSTSPR